MTERISVEWLRYFIAVAEELSFTKAALRLSIAQPPLTRHVQELEDALGAQLFSRRQRPLKLTAVGQALLPEARIVISAFEHALETARQASRAEASTIRIAVAASLAASAELAAAEHRHGSPNIRLEYSDVFSKDQPDNLRKCQVDVGFMRGPVDEGLNSIHLFSEKVYALLPVRHALARLTSIKIAQLAGESVILQDPQISQFHNKILELYANAGVHPGAVSYFTGSWLRPANQLRLKTEPQICFGLETHLALMNDRIPLPVEDPDATYPAFLAWRKEERCASILSFIDSARRAFNQGSTVEREISGESKSRVSDVF